MVSSPLLRSPFQPLNEARTLSPASRRNENVHMPMKVQPVSSPLQQVHQRQESLLVSSSTNHHNSSNINSKSDKEYLIRCFQAYVEMKKWNSAALFLRKHKHLALVTSQVKFVVQGENSSGNLLHFLSTIPDAPLALFQSLVKLHPQALLQKEQRGDRLSLHLALIKRLPYDVLEFLITSQPLSLKEADEDGNLPLHYACRYASSCIPLLLEHYGAAAQIPNTHQERLPLHCLAASDPSPSSSTSTDNGSSFLTLLQAVLQEYPQAIHIADRNGRLPIHVLCHQSFPLQWESLRLLIDQDPSTLVVKDWIQQTPYLLAKSAQKHSSRGHENDVCLQSLYERTCQERRKKHPLLFWTTPHHKSKPRKSINGVDLYGSYG